MREKKRKRARLRCDWTVSMLVAISRRRSEDEHEVSMHAVTFYVLKYLSKCARRRQEARRWVARAIGRARRGDAA